MDNIKRISEWRHILLDTSFIIDYMSDPEKASGNPKKKQNIEIAQLIMRNLSSKARKIRPQFYVTSITVGELIRIETKTVSRKIIETFSAGDVIFLPYGKADALLLSEIVKEYAKVRAPHQSLKDIEKAKKDSGCIHYREWISDDMKILACAKRLYDKRQMDVILTSDERTFFPISEFIGLPCRVLNTNHFPLDAFGDSIIEGGINPDAEK
jgi:hypothetical protein